MTSSVCESPAQRVARVRFPVGVRRWGKKSVIAGETVFISTSEIEIVAEEMLPADTTVEIEILVDGDLPAFQATVVEHAGPNLRLRFKKLADEVRSLIERLLADQNTFGDYAIEALLGSGAMAEVYRALVKEGPHAGRLIALKRLSKKVAADPLLSDLFVNEADLSRMLKHPGIVEVVQTGVIGETYFIAMEHLDGGSLDDILDLSISAKAPLPIDFCCYVVGLVANALEYTHTFCSPTGEKVEIVHCDVTPSNILVSTTGQVKLTDFGVAHIGALGGEDVIVGKAPYQPPEQIKGLSLTAESDVFALSAVLYEMLTNQRAFPGKSIEEIHKKILHYKVRPPHKLRPEIPEALSRFIMRGLSPDRSSDKLGFFKRLWRATFGRKIPKRISTAADFGARVRVFGEALYASPLIIQLVVDKLRQMQFQRPLFGPMDIPPGELKKRAAFNIPTDAIATKSGKI